MRSVGFERSAADIAGGVPSHLNLVSEPLVPLTRPVQSHYFPSSREVGTPSVTQTIVNHWYCVTDGCIKINSRYSDGPYKYQTKPEPTNQRQYVVHTPDDRAVLLSKMLYGATLNQPRWRLSNANRWHVSTGSVPQTKRRSSVVGTDCVWDSPFPNICFRQTTKPISDPSRYTNNVNITFHLCKLKYSGLHTRQFLWICLVFFGSSAPMDFWLWKSGLCIICLAWSSPFTILQFAHGCLNL